MVFLMQLKSNFTVVLVTGPQNGHFETVFVIDDVLPHMTPRLWEEPKDVQTSITKLPEIEIHAAEYEFPDEALPTDSGYLPIDGLASFTFTTKRASQTPSWKSHRLWCGSTADPVAPA
ncbi:hypothetical protein SELMODRAFT_417976 [Selaginella moellendorffii]|uniref:Uncharacterized protein n=1 Tax=Selaginella moellendorffii TaxID=88036 RepID=D8S497_SELML|nr:hypothetical protein SELMODRAFT_417976 [Selaginella moellendorffii]